VRVLEVSHAVAGPTACQILADYGAEVIKLERPLTGDIFRSTPGMGPSMFLATNRGKKSVVIDMKRTEGLELFYGLVKVSDVIVQNMGPGVAARLGITFKNIENANRRAIYCSIESFGTGPYEKIPAFDPVLQAASGIMSTTGIPPNHYARAGVSVVDVSAGLHAASGILTLLYRRSISNTGGELRVSLYDAASYFMSYWVTLFDLFGRDTTPLGTSHIFGAPYSLFRTKKGFVYIAIASDDAWRSFCGALGFDDLLADARYATNASRVGNKVRLERIIARRLGRFDCEEIVKALKDRGVPVAKMNTTKSLIEDPHFMASGILKEYKYLGKRYRTVVNPPIIDGRRRYTTRSPPELGADTDDVLKSLLGIDRDKMNLLRKDKVIQ
jgi:crotonobetainyl-CoA:carnitine CoA-transferase CaiB-like acyl-CoA transferase